MNIGRNRKVSPLDNNVHSNSNQLSPEPVFMADLGANPNPNRISPALPNSKQPRGGYGGKRPQRSAVKEPHPVTPLWRRRWGSKIETGHHNQNEGKGVKRKGLREGAKNSYPSVTDNGRVARDYMRRRRVSFCPLLPLLATIRADLRNHRESTPKNAVHGGACPHAPPP